MSATLRAQDAEAPKPAEPAAEVKPAEATETDKPEFGLEPDGSGLKKLEELPAKFAKKQDATGNDWTIAIDGSTEGTNSVTSAAMKLFVADAPFKAGTAEVSEDGSRIRLTEEREGGLRITRDVFFNSAQGGIRYLDVFENKGEADADLTVGYSTRLGNNPAAIYANTGKSSNGELGPKDAGIAIQSDDESGLPSVLMLLADEKNADYKPKVAFTEENELQAAYELSLKKGERSALLVWIGQRELTDSRSVRDAFDTVYLRRRLVDAEVPAGLASSVRNFDIGADGGVAAPDAENLFAVVRLCEELDVERAAEDILWVGAGSRLSGTAKASAEAFVVESRFGSVTVQFEDVAALQGGGGVGRQHRVYLRDGSVINGTAVVDGLAIEGAEGWKVDLNMNQMEYLLFHLAPEDGVASDEAKLFIQLHTGDTLAVAADDALALSFVSPWGELDVPARQLASMRMSRLPSPRYRIVLGDGSELTVFLVARPVEVTSARYGVLTFSSNEIARLWTAGGTLPEPDIEEEYEELEELPPGAFDGCLLQGSNILAGTIANESLHLVSGSTVTALSPAEITLIQRGDDEISELVPVFDVELRGGNQVTGHFQEKTIRVHTAARDWDVPVQHFLAARRQSDSGDSK